MAIEYKDTNKYTLGETGVFHLQQPKQTSFNDANWSNEQMDKYKDKSALQQIKKSNEETENILTDTQKRIYDYYRKTNGRLSQDDIVSITGNRIDKKTYQDYMNVMKQYAATQQKPDLTDLAAFQQAMYDRQEARNELDRLNEQRRVDRERLGQGVGEMFAMFGDIAKAHGGALVTPRTIEQKLAQLGERERNAYKLYTANQQRIEQDKLNNLLKEQERKNAAAQAEKEFANKLALKQFDLLGKSQLQKDNQEFQAAENKKKRDNDRIVAEIKGNGKDKTLTVRYNGEEVTGNYNSMMSKYGEAYGILKKAGYIPKEYLSKSDNVNKDYMNLFGSNRSSIDAALTEDDKLRNVVQSVLNDVTDTSVINQIKKIFGFTKKSRWE